MKAIDLLRAAAPIVAPTLEREFHRRDLCILATRVIIDVGEYFGVALDPVPVRVMVYNAAFAVHVEAGFPQGRDVKAFGDDAWSVGVGFGVPPIPNRQGTFWDGHLIAAGGGAFGDFAIWNAERPQHNIVIGPAVTGIYTGASMWRCANDGGTVIEYERIADEVWRDSPDWKDAGRRRPLVGKIIRQIRGQR